VCGFAGLAWWRSRRIADLVQRLTALEGAVRDLERELWRGVRPTATTEAPAARPAPDLQPSPDLVPAAPPPHPPRPPAEPPGPPPRPPAEPPGPPLRLPSFDIDWERWIGVRGAAVLGGVVLALAGIFFFRYSIEHGLIPPWLRVALGLATGTACLVGSARYLRERYPVAANALSGAGIVILYAAFWAARVRYELIGTAVAFGAMVLVTAACAALSWRHASLVIASIGLAGGFATPLLVSSGADRPIGLFGYLLLLDAGLLFLAVRRGWPVLAVASVAATAVYEVLWIGFRMGPERLLLGLGILAVFAAAFALSGRLREGTASEAPGFRAARAGGVLVPFAFALYFASDARFGPHLAPVAALLALVGAGAGFVGRVQRQRWIGLAAASASVAVVVVWWLRQPLDRALAFELAAIAAVLALVFHVFVEWDREEPGFEGPAPAALVANAGLLLLLVASPARHPTVSLAPWLAGWLVQAALAWRHGALPGRAVLRLAAAAGLWLGFSAELALPAALRDAGAVELACGALVAVAALLQTLALVETRRRAPPASAAVRSAEQAASLFAILGAFSVATAGLDDRIPALALLGLLLGMGFLALLPAARLAAGGFVLASALVTAFGHAVWAFGAAHQAPPAEASAALAIQLAAVLLFTAWPFACGDRFAREPWAWRASALAAPVAFAALLVTFERAFGEGAPGALALGLGAVSVAAAQAVRVRLAALEAGAARHAWTSRLVWYLAAALGFVTAAIPLQLEKEWITVAWALEGAAVLWLWQRFDHPGLKYLGLALLGAVTIRLVVNPALLDYHPRSGWPVLNWLLYTYGVPAAALLAASRLLARHELARLRPFEEPLYAGRARGVPVGAVAAGLCGLVVVFVWINLAIFDAFAKGPALELSFTREAARDLTLSLGWALYGLSLLAAGVGRGSRGLRWASLVLMMATIAKVFLHDLGELRDLYRVASLLGLAISLIAVSLAYQRFVLRREPAEER
jgi:uncharacterized membrane protein